MFVTFRLVFPSSKCITAFVANIYSASAPALFQVTIPRIFTEPAKYFRYIYFSYILNQLLQCLFQNNIKNSTY